MKHVKNVFSLFSLIVAILLVSAVQSVIAQQQRQSFSREDVAKAKAEAKNDSTQKRSNGAAAINARSVLGCSGPIDQVIDLGFEGLKFTSANYFAAPGGGEGGGFDKTPIFTTKVNLEKGCLNAHLSAIVGSRVTYGVAPLTLFQVTLRPENGSPRHMVGHYEQPYGGVNGPAVAIEAERDVDMFASNFFQKVGDGPHEIRPGVYYVDVWWSGNGPGGAIAADFVLKLYLMKQ